MKNVVRGGVALLALAALIKAPAANAALMLTSTGTSLGFTLTTFFSDAGSAGTYPIITSGTASDGSIIGSGYSTGRVYKFNDVDGQTFASSLGSNSLSGIISAATSGGNVYVGVLGGRYYQVANDLTLTPLPTAGGIVNASYGLWGIPGGHLFASTNQGLLNLDPTTGTYVLVGNSSQFGSPDGASVSPDGSIGYVEEGGSRIIGYSLTSPNPSTPVFNSGPLPGGPDGTGVISGGVLNGDIVVNNNDGTVGLIDPSLSTADPNYYRTIASGGSRGDLVSADPSNGTLLLSEYGFDYRLSCGSNCAIGTQVGGGGGTPMPEPASLSLLGLAAAGLIGLRRKRAV